MSLQPIIGNPLINDYITEDSRGKAFALKYMQLSGFFNSLIFYRFTSDLDPKISFAIASGFAFLAAVVTLFIVAEPRNTRQDILEELQNKNIISSPTPVQKSKKTVGGTIKYAFAVFI